MSGAHVAVDIGGTFTDILVRQGDSLIAKKVASTPDDPAEAVFAALDAAVPERSIIDFFVHGQTVGLNAFLERKGARVLLLMTRGATDSYTIARHDRKDMWALKYRKPVRLVPRRDVYPVRERVLADGSIDEPLDLSSLDPVLATVEADGIRSIAVCLLHAYLNPVHELAVRGALEARAPHVEVTLSHEVAREWREYERASTAVLNAYIAPPVNRYLETLASRLRKKGVETAPLIMQSSGGITTVAAVRQQPVKTLLSGPVGGTIGGAALGRAIGRPNLLCVDMGGTSFDLSLIVDGRPRLTTEVELQGLPALVPMIDVHTIGAGGGSIAWLEAGGLRVGPASAGSDPGPACYGRGGTRPTVTDANLILGRLNPHSLGGGALALDVSAATAAVSSLSELGLDETRLAEGIISVINSRMADAMRAITVAQGIDPREFSLVAYGGGGPTHAAWLAAELEIPEVIVPANPGTFSAWGMLQSQRRYDLSAPFHAAAAALDAEALEQAFVELEVDGWRFFADNNLGTPASIRTADMRYIGQEYTLQIGPAPTLDDMVGEFHAAHHARYGHSRESAAVELVTVRVAVVSADGHDLSKLRYEPPDGPLVESERDVSLDGCWTPCRILVRDNVPAGYQLRGPAVIEETTSTTVVPAATQASVDWMGNLVLTPLQAA